ncbi:hypothetical protein BD324DRAFT_622693 [Kockovaella imperatae]|uniref:Uncharacterized protein n=1 Tax=Kockovaella imperatae TaxID=4999 RepID=A0A1Y1UHX1_9TREE|nr:hypothetical protein BD324DRAFT_622693 [Kockovaella imperatae]ORX37638.1 hypothetical protein BD324DRAFT_622693 [Kockovaella imperatae]
MPLSIRPMVSAPLASCCTIFSIFGVVLLCVLGALYSRHVEALTGSTKDASDPDKVARACYGAAIIYAAFTVFCGMQMMVHQRYPRGVQL